MLNNKGFAVSAVLYTLLILFLVFLGVSLSMFSASNNLISYGNRDLVDGVRFEAKQVCFGKEDNTKEIDYNMLVKINSKYGTRYWPRDFDTKNGISYDGKISVTPYGQNIHANPVVPAFLIINYKDDPVNNIIYGYEATCGDERCLELSLDVCN